jgi:hypothetical protein
LSSFFDHTDLVHMTIKNAHTFGSICNIRGKVSLVGQVQKTIKRKERLANEWGSAVAFLDIFYFRRV